MIAATPLLILISLVIWSLLVLAIVLFIKGASIYDEAEVEVESVKQTLDD